MTEWNVKYEPDRDFGIISGDDAAVYLGVQFQHGPVADNGINGVQNEQVLDLVAVRLRDLNAKFPCRENSIAITHIETARLWLEERTRIRQHQGVEGQNVAHVS